MNIGTDILYIPRLKNILEKNSSFLKKVYTKKELELALKQKKPLYFYATRFAAKEAIIKATNFQYDFLEIEILKNYDGKPIVELLKNNNLIIDLSLSYDQDYAIAFCIANKK
ncbi:MAG: holo-ACP synthase [Firmicutes bacterium]|nr:holo-ACP synthase [Bacillota bacterium]